MLATLNDVMKFAEERKIAIGAFNSPNLESLQAILEAAEELNLPVIIQFAELHEPWIPLTVIGPIMVDMAKKAKIPVCVQLDHGEDLEYLQCALDMGFTAIMYDGSTLSYEENLTNTKIAVEMAAKTGASVEAELGSMGKREYGTGDSTGEEDETKIYTDSKLAKVFVKETGIDALACSFGTTHGIYLSEPKLDFDVVKNVRESADNIPIVMHGGSGVSREDFRKSIEAGVRKINYFTYMDRTGGNTVAEYVRSTEPGTAINFSKMVEIGRESMKKDILSAMKMFALMDEDV